MQEEIAVRRMSLRCTLIIGERRKVTVALLGIWSKPALTLTDDILDSHNTRKITGWCEWIIENCAAISMPSIIAKTTTELNLSVVGTVEAQIHPPTSRLQALKDLGSES